MTLIRLIESFILKKHSIPGILPMSKYFLPIRPVLAASLLILQIFTYADAQDIEARISIVGTSPQTALVEGRFVRQRQNTRLNTLLFLQEYAGVTGLGERVSSVRIPVEGGEVIFVDHAVNGFNGPSEVKSWGYSIGLAPMKNRTAAAHLSWLTSEGGILTLDDLLPQQSGKSAKISFDLPSDWKIYSTERAISANEYDVSDIEKAVFLVGRNWRARVAPAAGSSIRLFISGEWLFTDDQAANVTEEIFSSYKNLLGSVPGSNSQIAFVKFPLTTAAGDWEAGVRAANITIASSDMPFESQSVQRLHEQLRHEIFHLWIPSGVNLTGSYDWFYEGFALYQSLKTGVAVNRIRFDDFLDTLSRAYNIDASQSARRSLIDVSRNRWAGANTTVYARGMLAAFLCDLALMEKSKGRQSIANILRDIYERHRPPSSAVDGNTAVLAVLRDYIELVPIIDRNIVGAENIDWAELLKAAGLEAESRDQIVKLAVVAKPSGRQRDLLDKLGYNSWRRISKNR